MWETRQHYLDQKPEVIAEAGCNHCGSMDVAVEMIRRAKKAGADTIKFQSFVSDLLVRPEPDVLEFCRKAELTYQDHCLIVDACESECIRPLFSVFDEPSLDTVCQMGVSRVKIPSGQIFNLSLLRAVAERGLKTYLSTGMCSIQRVRRAYDQLIIYGLGTDDIVMMQCTTSYPAPIEDANLLVIEQYRDEFGCPVGYSDHVNGWIASVAAVALGATVIEKHFILDRSKETPDACVSLIPEEFSEMVKAISSVKKALGTRVKRVRKCEQKMFPRRDMKP